MKTVTIGSRSISRDAAPYVIAEAGVNHNGSPQAAHELIDAAAAAGAHAIKFQTFDPSLLVRAGTGTAAYQQQQTGLADQQQMLKDLVLPDSVWPELVSHAAEQKVEFLSTPFDAGSLDRLLALDVPAIKASSADLTNYLLLRAMRETGRPLLVSTGAADLQEVEAAVKAIGGDHDLILFHCVMAYPAPLDTTNLRAIETLAHRFTCPIGWSDHTVGATAATMAVAFGANVFEKHLTLDRSLPGPDHSASSNPDEFAVYVSTIADAWSALGTGEKTPAPSELETRKLVRRGLYAARDLAVGTVLGPDDVVALRPVSAIDATNDLTGSVITSPLTRHEPFDSSALA